jgi:hypothetical protein
MFPQLKDLFPANTPAEITIYKNQKDKYGENVVLYTGQVYCNISTKSYKQLTLNDRLVTYLKTTAYIFEEMNLDSDIITSGEMKVNGYDYTIENCITQRDPFNGEFLFYKLELK